MRTKTLLALWLGGAMLMAADLSLPAGVVVHPQATLNLVLAGAPEDLAGLQCDLEFDADALEIGLQAGPAASKAGKGLVITTPAEGRRRLLVAGMNQTSLGDGVLLVLRVRVKTVSASSGTYALRIQNAIGTTKDGSSVSMRTSDGSVVVPGGE